MFCICFELYFCIVTAIKNFCNIALLLILETKMKIKIKNEMKIKIESNEYLGMKYV